MRSVKGKIGIVKRGVMRISRYMGKLSRYRKDEAKQALKCAFEAGQTYCELKNMPRNDSLPHDMSVKVGPELRQHILRARKVFGEINELKEILDDLFEE